MTQTVEPGRIDQVRATLGKLATPAQRKAHAREVVPHLVGIAELDRQQWRDMLREAAGLTATDFDRLFQEATRAAAAESSQGRDGKYPPPETRAVPGCPGWFYGPGQVWKASGDDLTKTLDWTPNITEILVPIDDDGRPGTYHYVMQVGRDEIHAPHSEVRDGTVWDRAPDAYGLGMKVMRDVMTSIVTDLAHQVPRLTMVKRTGGHIIDGRRVYVRPDGRTVPDGVPVRLLGVDAKLAALCGPVARVATDDEIRAALVAMTGHGWAPLVGLGRGARTAGFSVVPVRAGCVVTGPPGAGKTLADAIARWLYSDYVWPPTGTVSFSATITDIECALAAEADFPAVLEDLALTGDASSLEVREAVKKIDTIYRSLANDTEVRGRRNRDLTKKPGNRINTIISANMQRVPALVQESLYRRVVVMYVESGTTDTDWYRDNTGPMLTGPLRTLGDRILSRLWEGDRQDAAALLNRCDQVGIHAISVEMDRVAPGWASSTDQFRGVVTAAGQYLGGLVLVAELAGLDPQVLLRPVVVPFAQSLVRQWSEMRDARDASDDVAVAVGELVRTALLNRRAHVRDDRGNVMPCVPGQTHQAHGLREILGGTHTPGGWDGQGVALYWLPDHGGVGVQSGELHSLVGDDPRIGGTALSLPDKLLRANAIRPSGQRDSPGVRRVRVGQDRHRFVILRPELVWDLPGGDTPEMVEPSPEPITPEPVKPVQPTFDQAQATRDAIACPACAVAGQACGPAKKWTGGDMECGQCRQPTPYTAPCGTALCLACAGWPENPPTRPAQRPVAAPAAPCATDDPRESVRGSQRAVPAAGEVSESGFARWALDMFPAATRDDIRQAEALWSEHVRGIRFSTPINTAVRILTGALKHKSIPELPPMAPDALAPMGTDRVWTSRTWCVPGPALPVGKWLAGYDVNGMWPSSGDVPLGTGDPVLYDTLPGGWGKMPGRVRLAETIVEAPHGLGGRLVAGMWVPRPILSYLSDREVPFTADRALLWPESRRWMAPHVKLYREARYALESLPASMARTIALRALKDTFNRMFGAAMHSTKYAKVPRPDWYAEVTGTGQARLFRNVDKVDAQLAGVKADCAWFVVDGPDSDPVGLDPTTGQLGKFKRELRCEITADITQYHERGLWAPISKALRGE